MMSNFIDNMFNIPILHLKVTNWEKKKEILLEMVNNCDLIVGKNDTLKTDFDIQNHNQTMGQHNDKITKILKEEIEIFCNVFNFNQYEMISSWFEIAAQENYHPIHNHGSIGYSSVCYIKYDHNVHTPTQFISPFNNFLDGSLLYYEPKVEEGSIIFFPSLIMHHTKPNNSKIERTILSFNLNIK
jgi:hypothetical protein